jgi:hypothetical protein
MRLSIRLMIVRILSLCIVVTLAIAATPIVASPQTGSAPAPAPPPETTPATVAAQQPETPPPSAAPRPWGQIRFGSLWLTPSVTLKEIGIDTNVFNSDSTNDKRADFMATGGPQLSLLWNKRRLRFEAVGGADYVFFLENATERSFQFSGSADLVFRASRRFELTAGASDATVRRRFSPEIDLRAKHRGRSVSMGASAGIAPRVSLRMHGSISERRFDVDEIYNNIELSRTLNEDTRSSGASVGFALTPWTRIYAGGTASAHRFPRMTTRDADAENYFVRVDIDTRALISGGAQVGRVNYRTRAAGIPDFSGISSEGTVGSRLGENTEVRLVFSRSVGLSYMPAVPFLFDKQFGGTLQRRLFDRLELQLQAHQHKYQYLGFVPSREGELPPADERLERYLLGFTVRATGDLRVGFNSEYVHRVTPSQFRSYEGFRFWTSLAYGRVTVKDRNAPLP